MNFNIRKWSYTLGFSFLIIAGMSAQTKGIVPHILAVEDSLKELAHVFRTDSIAEHRIEAAKTFEQRLLTLLKNEATYSHAFDSLPFISQLHAPDGSFRILTWELYEDKDNYKYFGIIQHKGNPKTKTTAQVTRLEDFSRRMRKIEDKIHSADNWYGALYYNLKAFKTPEGMKYALFGFDAFSFFERRKLMEILSFDEQRNPIFGAPIIDYEIWRKDMPAEIRTQNRFMLQYSAEAAATINYNEDQDMVMFDHLITMQSPFPNIPYVYVPDGSYQGFRLTKQGRWAYVEKVYHHVYDEAPRPAPVFQDGDDPSGKKKRDIFGRNK